jgi:hypothetical protein
MRPIFHGDVTCAARVLLNTPAAQRQLLCRRMFEEAARADVFVRLTGHVHSEFGNGSLMAAARKRELAPEPFLNNAEYCQCLIMVLEFICQEHDMGDADLKISKTIG